MCSKSATSVPNNLTKWPKAVNNCSIRLLVWSVINGKKNSGAIDIIRNMRLAGQGERALLDKFIMQISSANSYIYLAGRFTLQAANMIGSETIVVKCLQHLSSRHKLACSKKS